jgi:multisubunit Na+/H+ antiporter MnhB subunit
VAGSEPVTSPDQHKPTPVKQAYVAGVVVIIALVLLSIGSSITTEERAWLYGIAGGLAFLIIADATLRRNGLRSE